MNCVKEIFSKLTLKIQPECTVFGYISDKITHLFEILILQLKRDFAPRE